MIKNWKNLSIWEKFYKFLKRKTPPQAVSTQSHQDSGATSPLNLSPEDWDKYINKGYEDIETFQKLMDEASLLDRKLNPLKENNRIDRNLITKKPNIY